VICFHCFLTAGSPIDVADLSEIWQSHKCEVDLLATVLGSGVLGEVPTVFSQVIFHRKAFVALTLALVQIRTRSSEPQAKGSRSCRRSYDFWVWMSMRRRCSASAPVTPYSLYSSVATRSVDIGKTCEHESHQREPGPSPRLLLMPKSCSIYWLALSGSVLAAHH
jgi:hypothetical protein